MSQLQSASQLADSGGLAGELANKTSPGSKIIKHPGRTKKKFKKEKKTIKDSRYQRINPSLHVQRNKHSQRKGGTLHETDKSYSRKFDFFALLA